LPQRRREDLRLVARLQAGDEDAFETFFERSFPALFRFALARVRYDADDAEEVVQATLIAAIPKLGTYRGEAALLTWLCTLCRHQISEHHRRRRRQPRMADLIEETPEVVAALDSLTALGDGPEEALRRKEIGRLVQVTLDRLPGTYGDVLEWKYAVGLSVREIAARLGVSPKAAESQLTRASNAFRDGFGALVRAGVDARPVPET
jgi:RNA polymerase sigma-70 factor (ECF subfamily)